MNSSTLQRAAQWRLQAVQRRLAARLSRVPLSHEDTTVSSTAGYQLSTRWTWPSRSTGRLPGVVINPGIHQGRAAVEGYAAVVNAAEVARLGFVVASFDPAGRGDSWGEEDYGGAEHQDDLRTVIKHLAASPHCDGTVGILSLSLGVASSVAAAARWPQELPLRWLIDWEGPCDREIITSGGTILVPAAGHSLEDDTYWFPREATRTVGQLPCGYVRLQALPDHAQPAETRHALRMIHAARAGALPWFQLNDHPRGEVPERANWIPGGPWASNRAILRKIRTLG